MCSEAIAWNNIKPHARHNHDPSFTRFGITRCAGFKNVDLSRGIKIVYAGPHTGIEHRFGCSRKGAGDMEHDSHTGQPCTHCRRIGEVKCSTLQATLSSDRYKADPIPSGKHWLHPKLFG